jgi:hypothetical protein
VSEHPAILIALDPGTTHPAVAVFNNRRIHFVTVGSELAKRGESVSNATRIGAALVARVLGAFPLNTDADYVAEWPMPYHNKSAMHKDVERLQAVVEAFVAPAKQPVARYTPTKWKGGVPKAAHHKRLERFLVEQNFVPTLWAVIKDDVLRWWDEIGPDARDAIGIGWFHLGITGRGGTVP